MNLKLIKSNGQPPANKEMKPVVHPQCQAAY